MLKEGFCIASKSHAQHMPRTNKKTAANAECVEQRALHEIHLRELCIASNRRSAGSPCNRSLCSGAGRSLPARRLLPQSGGLVLPERAGSGPGFLCVPVVGIHIQGAASLLHSFKGCQLFFIDWLPHDRTTRFEVSIAGSAKWMWAILQTPCGFREGHAWCCC